VRGAPGTRLVLAAGAGCALDSSVALRYPKVKTMAHSKSKLTVEELKNLIFQLPPKDLVALVDAIESRAETVAMMQLAETAFREWDEAGEDIYDADT